MTIDIVVFQEMLRKGARETANSREWDLADSKLWYGSIEQAKAYLRIQEDKNYRKGQVQAEISLLDRELGDISNKLSGQRYNLVDLGCGSGEKAAIILAKLSKKKQLRYCPIDISPYLLETARSRVERLHLPGPIEVKGRVGDILDIEDIVPNLRSNGFEYHLISLLGNTLGNVDGQSLLEKISQSMQPEDYLLIGMGLRNGKKEENLIKEYSSLHINKFFSYLPKKIGLSANNIEFETRLTPKGIEILYRVKEDQAVSYLGTMIQFKANDRILVGKSHKYTKGELSSLLGKWFDATLYFDKNKTHAVALCTITPS